MSYFKDINVQASDSASIDAFGRWRVSSVTSQYDQKQIHDDNPLFIDKVFANTGTYSYSATFSQSTLSTAASGDYVVFQTKQRFNYQSGKSQLIFWTFNNFAPETNVYKKVGYFSTSTVAPYTSTPDGIYIESDSVTGEESLHVWRSATETATANRSDWDDPLDGTGPSAINHDFDNNTILAVDFEWLGIGRVRFFLIKDGVFVKFHEFDFTDTTGIYMTSPNQPLRWSVRQNGAGSGSLNVICASVNSEGSVNLLGKILSDNLNTSAVNANTVGTKYALLGIRLQPTQADTLIDLLDFSVLATTADNQLVEVWLNPTVAGTFNYATYSDSSIAIAKGDTAGNPSANTVTGGTLLFSRYISSQNATPIELENALRLGMDIQGNPDEIVLTTTPLSSNSDVTGSITWRELT